MGYNRKGYNKKGYNKNGCNPDGLNKSGNPCNEYNENGLDQESFDRSGFNENGYNRNGFDKEGFDKLGCNRKGKNRLGNPCSIYNQSDFDEEGFNKKGVNREGYDRQGFDINGCNRLGFNRSGKKCNVFDEKTGLDNKGFNRLGYDIDGYGRDGCDRNGYNRFGKTCIESPNVKLTMAEEIWMARQLKNKEAVLQQLVERAKGPLSTFETKSVSEEFPQDNQIDSDMSDGGEGFIVNDVLIDESTEDDLPIDNGKIEIPNGSLLYAVLKNTVNSDYPGLVMAKIVGGPLDGVDVTGSFAVPFIDDAFRPRDKLQFNFSNMIYNRETISMSAIALDSRTFNDFISGKASYHYIERWGGLIAGNIMEGIGKAVLTAQNTVAGDGSNNVISAPITATGDQLKASLAVIGEEVSDIARKKFDRPPTIIAERGTMLTIYFTSEVNESN
jgi:hypothetical protein